MKKREDRKEEVLVCRCEEVTEKEIVDAIRLGVKTADGVKRVTRAGMGLCQGKTCRLLVERLIARETGTGIGELPPPSIRLPIRPVKIDVITGDKNK